ncbi:copper chaperone PCu(A)C [Oceanibacterium hippocampi]|uniref:Copper chaperone PCu(A)C n=1 Tax=Oceanibacterium hippocampi TaxID=745714 RepID=A0A1Y5S1S0_9PROT|nr:copper chaperone PCu(A)C [Oceanibacterium hippocampi]SLN30609.1 hypothetical protein OCH7691_01074 [Oceanibacterium hippocampi]
MIRPLSIALFLALFLASFAGAASAHDYKLGDLMIEHPWGRAIIASRPAGAFLTIVNHGAADRLVGARSPAAEKVEIHTHINDNGVMRMRRIEVVDIDMHQTVALQPGGLHLMLFGLKALPADGEMLPVMLRFEKAGEVEVMVRFEKPTTTSGGDTGHDMKSMKHDHGNMKTTD